MPYEIIVRFCVTDYSIAADLETIGFAGDVDDATQQQIAEAFAAGLQAAAADGDLPDCWFAVDPDTVSTCDVEAWTHEHLYADPKKLVSEVLAMLESGSYHSSYESRMIDKLRSANEILKNSK